MLDYKAAIFIETARLQSISQAARELFISQPAVTAAIQKLEEQFGIKLFLRHSRGLELTPAGHLLYRHLLEMKNGATRLENEMMLLQGTLHGKLLLGSSPTFGDYILPHLLGQFKCLYPHISFSLYTGNNRHIYAQLQEGRIEIAFLVGKLPGKRLSSRKIMEDELVLIVSPQHPFSNLDSIGKNELSEHPLVLRERGSGSRKDMEDAFLEIGISPSDLTVIAEFHSLEAIKSAVEANLGAALISRWAVSRELKAGTVKAVRVYGANLCRDIYAATLPDAQLTEAASRLLSMTPDLPALINNLVSQ